MDQGYYNPRNISTVDHNALGRMAGDVVLKDVVNLDFACNALEHGTKLGFDREGRRPSQELTSKFIME